MVLTLKDELESTTGLRDRPEVLGDVNSSPKVCIATCDGVSHGCVGEARCDPPIPNALSPSNPRRHTKIGYPTALNQEAHQIVSESCSPVTDLVNTTIHELQI